MTRPHGRYTMVCAICQKIMWQTKGRPRIEVRYGLCAFHSYTGHWQPRGVMFHEESIDLAERERRMDLIGADQHSKWLVNKRKRELKPKGE